MAYVKGSRLDRQSRVAQLSQGIDQVGNAFHPAGIAQATTVTAQTEWPNPVALEAKRSAQSRVARISAQDSQVGNQLLPLPSPVASQTDWPLPASFEKRRGGQYLAARSSSNDDQIGNAFNPAGIAQATTVTNQTDWPNPVALTARRDAQSRIARISTQDSQVGNQILPLPSPVTQQTDWPNPVALETRRAAQSRAARSASDDNQIGNAFAPAGIAQATTVTAQTNWPNPVRLAPRAATLYDPGTNAIMPPAAIAPPVAVLLDWPNPTIRRLTTHSTLYDPGRNAFSPAGIAQATTVTNQTDWQLPTRRAPRAASLDPGTNAFAPTAAVTGTGQFLDQPNPRVRPIRQYEVGENAILPLADPVTSQTDWPNPQRRPVRQYEAGAGALIPRPVAPIQSECSAPVRRRVVRPGVYEPGTSAFAPPQAVQPVTVLRHDWPNPTLRARRLHPAVTTMSDTPGHVLGGIARDLSYTVALMDSRWSATLVSSRWSAAITDSDVTVELLQQ